MSGEQQNISREPEAEQTEQPAQKAQRPRKKNKLSGAYWYSLTDEQELKKQSTTRALLYIIAALLQVTVLVMPQKGLEYITYNIPSYAYTYVWIVFAMLGISVYVIIMSYTRSKLQKRIPVEYAPKRGFSFFTFVSDEIAAVTYLVMLALEISFVCFQYDGFGLAAVFVCALSLAASIWARHIAHAILRNAERIEAPEE